MSTADGSFAPWRPQARLDRLVMSHVGEEVLVYDETSHAIHRLNLTSHAIWALCDGTRTISAIGQVASAALGTEVSEAVVRLALSQLAGANLLVGALPSDIQKPRSSRRRMLRRMAVAGGVALPALASVTAPTAAGSWSCIAIGGEGCSSGPQCCSGFCDNNTCQALACGEHGSFCLSDAGCCRQTCYLGTCLG